MKTIFETLTNLCNQEGWDLTELVDGKEAMIEFKDSDNVVWSCFAYARENQKQFVFYSVRFDDVPISSINAVNEFITRINYGLAIGNFEINLDKGAVRFKTSFDFDKTEPTEDLLAPLVYANITIMGNFLPALDEVAEGKISALEAFNMIKRNKI
jgi:hypothetical protein